MGSRFRGRIVVLAAIASVSTLAPVAEAALLEDECRFAANAVGLPPDNPVCDALTTLDALAYQYRTIWRGPAGDIERIHAATTDVPALLDVDDVPGPDISGVILAIDSSEARVRIDALRPAQLPVLVQVVISGSTTFRFGYDARGSSAPASFQTHVTAHDGLSIDIETASAPQAMSLVGDIFDPYGNELRAGVELDPFPATIGVDVRSDHDANTFAVSVTDAPSARYEIALGSPHDPQRIHGEISALPSSLELRFEPQSIQYEASETIDQIVIGVSQSSRVGELVLGRVPTEISARWGDTLSYSSNAPLGDLRLRYAGDGELPNVRAESGFWYETFDTEGCCWFEEMQFHVVELQDAMFTGLGGLRVRGTLAPQPLEVSLRSLVRSCSNCLYSLTHDFNVSVSELPSGFDLQLPESGGYFRVLMNADTGIDWIRLIDDRPGSSSMDLFVRDVPRSFSVCLRAGEPEGYFGCTRGAGGVMQNQPTNGPSKAIFAYDDFGTGHWPMRVDFLLRDGATLHGAPRLLVQDLTMRKLEVEFGDRPCDFVGDLPTDHCGHVWFDTDGANVSGRVDAHIGDTSIANIRALELEFPATGSTWFDNRYGAWEGFIYDSEPDRKHDAHGQGTCAPGTLLKVITDDDLSLPDWTYQHTFC